MKRLISITAGLIGVFLSLSAANGQGTGFGDLNSYFSFTYGDGGVPSDVNNVSGQQTTMDGLSVRLFGDFGPIDGARFRGGFVLNWSGSFDGPINAGNTFAADLDFNVQATGGTLAWSFYANLWTGEHARILTDLMPMPASGQVSGAHFESSPVTQPADFGSFEGYLHIDWTGFGPTDTFSLTVPQNSIDVTFMRVPEPSASLLTVMAFALLNARRLMPSLVNRINRRT